MSPFVHACIILARNERNIFDLLSFVFVFVLLHMHFNARGGKQEEITTKALDLTF